MTQWHEHQSWCIWIFRSSLEKVSVRRKVSRLLSIFTLYIFLIKNLWKNKISKCIFNWLILLYHRKLYFMPKLKCLAWLKCPTLIWWYCHRRSGGCQPTSPTLAPHYNVFYNSGRLETFHSEPSKIIGNKTSKTSLSAFQNSLDFECSLVIKQFVKNFFMGKSNLYQSCKEFTWFIIRPLSRV